MLCKYDIPIQLNMRSFYSFQSLFVNDVLETMLICIHCFVHYVLHISRCFFKMHGYCLLTIANYIDIGCSIFNTILVYGIVETNR